VCFCECCCGGDEGGLSVLLLAWAIHQGVNAYMNLLLIINYYAMCSENNECVNEFGTEFDAMEPGLAPLQVPLLGPIVICVWSSWLHVPQHPLGTSHMIGNLSDICKYHGNRYIVVFRCCLSYCFCLLEFCYWSSVFGLAMYGFC
jgi:hypothetical protein